MRSASPSPQRLAIARHAVLAATVVLSFAASATHAEDPPAAAAKVAAAERFADIDAGEDALEAEIRRTLRRQRYEWTLDYVRQHGGAADAESAWAALLQLGEEVENWHRLIADVDAYLSAVPRGRHRLDALERRAGALARVGRRVDAVAAYQALARELDAVKESEFPRLHRAFTAWAGVLERDGQIDAAKAVCRQEQEAFAATPAAEQVKAYVEARLKQLDLIGKPALALPAGSKDLEGRPISMADYAGKVVLIDFWATWCAPCRKEVPFVTEAYRRFKSRGFEVLGVSLDQNDATPAVREWKRRYDTTWRDVYDPNYERRWKLYHDYEIEGFPSPVLVGRDGKVIGVGYRGRAIVEAVEAALEAKR